MHECLQVPEIQRLIFEALETDRKSTLYAMALTCRAFKDVALSCLWENLDSIYPLLHNLPEDLLEFSSYGRKKRLLDFNRPLEPEDWEIYHKYASRVRAMHIRGESDISEQILDGLCSYRPAQILSPQLHSLLVEDLNAAEYDYSRLLQNFFGPTVKHFSVTIFRLHSPNLDRGLASSLSSLGRLSPSLITFRMNLHGGEFLFSYPATKTRLLRGLSRMLQDIKTLKSIYLRPFTLTPDIICPLARLKSLRQLEIDIWPEESPFRYDESYELSNLTSLHISNATWKTFSNFLGIVVTSPMKQLHVNFYAVFEAWDLDLDPKDNPKFIKQVLNRLAMISALEHVIIREPVKLLPPSDPHDKAGLRLGQLKNVKTFEFVCSAASLLGNTWLEMISSWSQLCVLRVFVDEYEFWPNMTLVGLSPILTNCMNLHTLEVSVRCKGFDSQPLANAKIAPVRIVKFPNSPIIDDTSIIIRCLTVMFPTAQSITGSYDSDEDWEDINQAFSS